MTCLPVKLLFIINNETHDDVVFLWHELGELQSYITQASVELYMETVFHCVKKWLETFLGLEKKGGLGYSRVTLYELSRVSRARLLKSLRNFTQL